MAMDLKLVQPRNPPLDRPGPASRAVAMLGAMVFIVSLGYGAGLPLVQPYLLRYLGAATSAAVAWHVGMLGGVYLFALFVFAPMWGWLSDRRGRTPILVAGFAACLVGGAAAALATNLAMAYAARLLAGAGAAAILPTAQAYIADISTPDDRGRRFVLLGSAAFVGFLAGPALGSWLAGPVMGAPVGQMGGMLNWPPMAIALAGVPVLLFAPGCLGCEAPMGMPAVPSNGSDRRSFVRSSMLLALLAAFAVGTFEVGFTLFGGQTLGLASTALAAMFITCSLAMLAAQSMLLLPSVRRRIDHRWVAGAFAGSALALGVTSLVPDAGSLGLLIAVVATGAGMIGPVLSYELLKRRPGARGSLLGRQAAAGNLGQALGSVAAGSMFALRPSAPFWFAALVLLVGAAMAITWWGPARQREAGTGSGHVD